MNDEDKKLLDIAKRIWAKDKTLWPESADDPKATEQGLGWLDLPAQLRDLIAETRELRAELWEEGIKHIVVLGMGGSSMAVEALRMAYDIPESRLCVIDTLHGNGIESAEQHINTVPEQLFGSTTTNTMFVVSSKSGTTRETLALEDYFRRWLRWILYEIDPDDDEEDLHDNTKQHFVAITDAGTQLAKRKGEFRRVIECYPNVGGRFSALSAFGIVPFMLAGGPAESLLRPLEKSVAELQLTGEDSITYSTSYNADRGGDYRYVLNKGICLGEFLYKATAKGVGQVRIMASPKLKGFAMWVEQLLAESTGKDGKGLIPIVGEPVEWLDKLELADYESDNCSLVELYIANDGRTGFKMNFMADRPKLHDKFKLYSNDLALDTEDNLGGYFLVWEFAVAVAGALMGLNPFDQPDVEIAKKRATQIAEKSEKVTEMPNALEVYECVNAITDATKAGKIEYIAILAYLNPRDDEIMKLMGELRTGLTDHFKLPTLFGFGPRYLHSTGQLLKGGPQTAFVLGLWQPHGESSMYSKLTNMMKAQARADFEVMIERGQKVGTVAFPCAHCEKRCCAGEHAQNALQELLKSLD